MRTFNELHATFNDFLDRNHFSNSPENLYEPINYIMGIGGKRIRPILLLMSYNLFQEKVEEALPAAYAVELFHNFSLIHDDIMDQAPLRRGQPTVHIKYGSDAGILSGDLTLIQAYQFLLEYTDKATFRALVEVFNDVAIKVCEGQQYDMNFEKQEKVELAAYLLMIEYKTAVLLSGALRMGAIIAGANLNAQAILGQFGKNIGIAFQLQDDILDSFGDPEKFGKKVGGDIAQNKKTILQLKTIELANKEELDLLKFWMNKSCEPNSHEEQEKISAVKQIYIKSGALKEAKQLKEVYQTAAFNSLATLDIPDSNKAELRNLAISLLGRDS